MSFLSFLGSFLPKRLFTDSTQTNQTGETGEDVDIMEQSHGFSLFPRLPAELRHMIINEALYEHEEALRRVVLFDPLIHRISPTKELVGMASPLLFVNAEFRSIALKVYTKVGVFDLGAPKDDQYSDERDWYGMPINRDYLIYDSGICYQIRDEVEDQDTQKGCLYINPEKDTFITGIIPRQVALTTAFRFPPGERDQPWTTPRDFLTDRLEEDTCAKITTMRELAWDLDDRCLGCGTCLLCGRMNRPCCTDDCFSEKVEEWDPLHSQEVFTGVESFGFYILAAGDDMQQFLIEFTVMGGKNCLEEEWDKRCLEVDLERREA